MAIRNIVRKALTDRGYSTRFTTRMTKYEQTKVTLFGLDHMDPNEKLGLEVAILLEADKHRLGMVRVEFE